jgi:DNA polymerase III sliding clamp (beta) subunit (PCNA family)
MELKIQKNAKLFRSLMDICSNIGESANFITKNDSLFLSLYSGGTTLLSLRINKEFFDSFVADEEQHGLLIADVLKGFSSTELTIKTEDNKVLFFSGKTKYTAPILTDVSNPPEPPSIEYSFSFNISMKSFKDALNTLSGVNDEALAFFTKDNGLHAHMKTSLREMRVLLGEANGLDTPALYTHRLINMILSKKDDLPLTIYMEQNKPFKYVFNQDGVELSVLVAPRV